jgi:hypothetical protein
LETWSPASDGLLEHAAQRFTIQDSVMDSKSDDATGAVIHHHQHQCVRNIMDSQQNKSSGHRLS